MTKQATAYLKTRAVQEAETEAHRLIEQIEEALVGISTRFADEGSSLEAAADRIERTARNLAVVLRELANEQSPAPDKT